MDEEEPKVPVIRHYKTGEKITLEIPQCCREGWDDCPHVVKPQKPKKRNIGLQYEKNT